MKKLFTFCFSLLLLIMLPAVCFADADTAAANKVITNYNIWIAGERITSENLSGDGWNYDPVNNVLSLNNADISGSYYGAAIYCDGIGLTISIEGNNIVSSNGVAVIGEDIISYGLYLGTVSTEGLGYTITGSGTLCISSTDKSNILVCTDCYGIYCMEDLDIGEGCTVEITGGTSTDASHGIYLKSGYDLTNSGSLTCCSSASLSSYGIEARSGIIYNYGTLSCSTSTDFTTTTSVAISARGFYNYGKIYAHSDDGKSSKCIITSEPAYNYGTLMASSGDAWGMALTDNSSCLISPLLYTYGDSNTVLVSGCSNCGDCYGFSGQLYAYDNSEVYITSGSSTSGNTYAIIQRAELYDNSKFYSFAGKAQSSYKESISHGSIYDHRTNN